MPNLPGETPHINVTKKEPVKVRKDTEPNPTLRLAVDEVVTGIYLRERETAVKSLARLVQGISSRLYVDRKELAIVLVDKVATRPKEVDFKFLELWKKYEIEVYDLTPTEERDISDLNLSERSKVYINQVIDELEKTGTSIVQGFIDLDVIKFQSEVARKYRVKEEDLAKFVRIRIEDNKRDLAQQKGKKNIV